VQISNFDKMISTRFLKLEGLAYVSYPTWKSFTCPIRCLHICFAFTHSGAWWEWSIFWVTCYLRTDANTLGIFQLMQIEDLKISHFYF